MPRDQPVRLPIVLNFLAQVLSQDPVQEVAHRVVLSEPIVIDLDVCQVQRIINRRQGAGFCEELRWLQTVETLPMHIVHQELAESGLRVSRDFSVVNRGPILRRPCPPALHALTSRQKAEFWVEFGCGAFLSFCCHVVSFNAFDVGPSVGWALRTSSGGQRLQSRRPASRDA